MGRHTCGLRSQLADNKRVELTHLKVRPVAPWRAAALQSGFDSTTVASTPTAIALAAFTGIAGIAALQAGSTATTAPTLYAPGNLTVPDFVPADQMQSLQLHQLSILVKMRPLAGVVFASKPMVGVR